MIDGKRGGEWCTALHPERTTAARHGEGTKGRGRGCAPWGDIGGGRERQEQGWKVGRHDERKSSAWRSGEGAAPRARIYIAAIYSIFIYILSIYL